MSFLTYVDEYPPCDFCDKGALVDAKTIWGPWANMCSLCWLSNSIHQLGLGKGQLLIKRGDNINYSEYDLRILEHLEGLDYDPV